MFRGRNQPSKQFIQTNSMPEPISGCWLWTGYVQSSGYGQPRIGNKCVLAHRLAWELWNGQHVPDGLIVMHSCDNRQCVNPAHLSVGTQLDNMLDAKRKGRPYCCHPRSTYSFTRKKRVRKLTDQQVREIRATRYYEPLASVAQRYGVSIATISTIRRGKRKQLVI